MSCLPSCATIVLAAYCVCALHHSVSAFQRLPFAKLSAKSSVYVQLRWNEPIFSGCGHSSSSSKLFLFDFFKSKTSDTQSSSPVVSTTATTSKPVDKEKIERLRNSLEKVSNKQNRDYEAEARARAPRPQEPKDKQESSFNFNKANEFPNLYKGWIRKDGDQIGKQMVAAAKAALQKKEQFIEVLFDPVPNLDEVAFGTAWNKRLREEVVADLKVPDYATNRGGPATLEWSNIYWANRLGNGLLSGNKKKALAISISGEGTTGKNLPTMSKGMKLVTLQAAKKGSFLAEGESIADYSFFVLLSPCQESHYKDAIALSKSYNVPIIALNAPYSYRYDIGCGKPFTLAYVMKRVPKGWFYRQFPKPFEVIIEGPNYEVFRAITYTEQPTLPQLSKVAMQASEQRYGAIGNDRIFQNRL